MLLMYIHFASNEYKRSIYYIVIIINLSNYKHVLSSVAVRFVASFGKPTAP